MKGYVLKCYNGRCLRCMKKFYFGEELSTVLMMENELKGKYKEIRRETIDFGNDFEKFKQYELKYLN